MSQKPHLTASRRDDRVELVVTGSWTAAFAGDADRLVEEAGSRRGKPGRLIVNAAGLEALDTFGAWLLERLLRNGTARGQAVEIAGLPERYRGLVEEVRQANRREPAPRERLRTIAAGLDRIGRGLESLRAEALSFLFMLGAVGTALARVIVRPQSFRIASAVHHLDRVGWQAIGIVLLITFLIGGIIAQQGIFHFRRFGADDYVVDLVGILVLREIGVLIVAIMVAGRSGSAYTAELGSMKMREEIDALRTMGLDPVQILVLPRVAALVVALPVLAFLGGMAALFGGGLVAWLYGGMDPEVFIVRLKDAVSVTHFQVGMIKAPFMALVIGIVAASEGLRVGGSAESLGLKTTASVVKSIFLVIVLDGLFAIFFASIGM